MRLLFCAYLLGYICLILNVGLTALNDHNITLPYLFSYMVIQNKLIKNGVELVKLVSIFMAYMSLPIGFSILTIRSRAIHEGRANAVFLESSIMAGLVRRGLIRRSFILAFVYFKTDKCKETLKKYLSKGNQSNRAGEYLSKTCGMYIRRLVDNSMPTPLSGQRHTKHGMCLCQMVESEYFGELV
ncbi:uncharacterized protein [Ptychodera flava]|uniref:uncharacterized protein isoform X1 n=1 Tax=Ptychodera flava TaxID=63121 RepID=UPI00396AAE7D